MANHSTVYQKYMRSNRWAKRKARFAESHPRVCKCGSTDKIELHHKTYARLGSEPDDDLVWLCRSCHVIVEQLIDEGRLSRDLHDFFDPARAQPYQPIPHQPIRYKDWRAERRKDFVS